MQTELCVSILLVQQIIYGKGNVQCCILKLLKASYVCHMGGAILQVGNAIFGIQLMLKKFGNNKNHQQNQTKALLIKTLTPLSGLGISGMIKGHMEYCNPGYIGIIANISTKRSSHVSYLPLHTLLVGLWPVLLGRKKGSREKAWS